MRIRKGNIFTTIDAKEFGIYQKKGFEKVIVEPLTKLEDVENQIIKDEQPIREVEQEPIKDEELIDEQPIREVEQETPKPRRGRRSA